MRDYQSSSASHQGWPNRSGRRGAAVATTGNDDLDVIVADALAVTDWGRTIKSCPSGLAINDRERVDDYVARASSNATLRAYRSDWRLFCTWCAEVGYRSLPASPTTVAAFLTLLAEQGYVPHEADGDRRARSRWRMPVPLARSTIGRRLAAIVFVHRAAGLEPPTHQPGAIRLEKAMQGIRRAKRDEVPRRKSAVDGDVLHDMLRAIRGGELRDHRNRALLAIGMAGAFRRSELAALRVAQVSQDSCGLLVRIPSSKTDQEGRGHTVAIPTGRRLEPVRHYRTWISEAGITDGPVFRKLTPQGRLTDKPMSPQAVALVVKTAAALAGYSPAQFSGHSLRAGFLTEAGRRNANLFKMQEQSRHASIGMVAVYVRDHDRFRDHAGKDFL